MLVRQCLTICRTVASSTQYGGSVHMDMHERLKLIPYETAVGLMIATVSTLIFGVFGFTI